ncbi:MAG: ABC transporter permease [Aeromicrobium sp.]
MSLAEYAAREGLHKVGGRPPILAYFVDVWRRRAFIYSLARFRIEADNGRNRLGMGWVLLKPLINAAVYGTIFGILLGRSNRPDQYVLFLVIGVFMFEYFSSCFTSGAKSITKNANLVQSLSFPRMSLPLALVAQRLLEFAPMIAIMTGLVLAFGNMPQWEWLLLIPLVALFTVFNTGLTLITARLTVHFRDLTQLLPFVSRFFFYTSGVFFSVERRFGENETIMQIADIQPIHEFMDLARCIMLTGPDYVVTPVYWAYGAAWSFMFLIVGAVYFWAAEERYGRDD